MQVATTAAGGRMCYAAALRGDGKAVRAAAGADGEREKGTSAVESGWQQVGRRRVLDSVAEYRAISALLGAAARRGDPGENCF